MRHNRAARFVSTLLQTEPANTIRGIICIYTVGRGALTPPLITMSAHFNPKVLSIITRQQIARHGYPPGDLLLPFGQFTLCRACGEENACVVVEYLALRRGREMDAQCAPLRKSNPTAVPFFKAVAALRFSPCYLIKETGVPRG